MTKGNIYRGIVIFSLPMIIGNLIQQMYNIVDTLIVGRYLGASALSAVGSSYSIMVLLTSMVIGVCMGANVVFSHFYGARDIKNMRVSIFNSFVFTMIFSLIINLVAIIFFEGIISFINVPEKAILNTREYLFVILCGMSFVSLYNFFSSVLRSIGNTVVPLIAVGISAVLNIFLDLVFVVYLGFGVDGAAFATVISQAISAVVVSIYCFIKCKEYIPSREECFFSRRMLKLISENSILTSIQQSIMNFGILLVQGLVNSFGYFVSAAFAIVVKIDAFAYMPAQDFGNAFSTFVAQNMGAKKKDRVEEGIKKAVLISSIFCFVSSFLVFIFSRELMEIFVGKSSEEIVNIGIRYLRIEGSFYIGIGILFLMYALYRGLGRPSISIVLTVISLGTRVALAYLLSSIRDIGVIGIWWSVPIGWFLADVYGFIYFYRKKKKLMDIEFWS